METISILTTTRNRRNLLRKTMESVLAQDYGFVEHIIIDAASSDDTQEVLREYATRYAAKKYVLKWISEKDSGQAEGMNKGLKMISGDFVVLLNDDDFLEPGALAKFLALFHEHPHVDFVYGENYVWHQDTGERKLVRYRLYSLNDMLNKGCQIPQCSCMFRSSLVARCGGFDETLRHVAEHELFLRFAKGGAKFFYVDIPLQTILEHAGRKTNMAPRSAVIETKNVQMRHGASRFSRFYILYLRDRYFGGFFDMMKQRVPWLFAALKRRFNAVTNGGDNREGMR